MEVILGVGTAGDTFSGLSEMSRAASSHVMHTSSLQSVRQTAHAAVGRVQAGLYMSGLTILRVGFVWLKGLTMLTLEASGMSASAFALAAAGGVALVAAAGGGTAAWSVAIGSALSERGKVGRSLLRSAVRSRKTPSCTANRSTTVR